MPKGKPIDPEMVYKIMASYAVTNNYSETARACGLGISTVRNIVLDNQDKKEFRELCKREKECFAEKAGEIIDKGLALLNRRISTALQYEEELEMLIDEIYSMSPDEVTAREKVALVNKIKNLQLQRMGEITTAIGTLYDKRALALGESTENTKISVTLPKELDEFAG